MEKVEQITGTHILFGHSLASHFNINVVKAAEHNNVHFVMLTLNATHLLLPWYCSIFFFKKIMKSYTTWMKEGSVDGRVVWQEILSFFTEVFNEHSRTKCEKKLQSGFRACGICPLDCSEPLHKYQVTILISVKAVNG